MCKNQKDLFGNPLNKLDSAAFLAHTLRNHKVKLYKKCSNRHCKNEIVNKPNRHYCMDHIIDEAIETDVVIAYVHPFVSSPVTR